MAKVRPFQALIYNPEKAGDLAVLVCPPYDVISDAQQECYHKSSPYNFLHILLAKDIKGVDKYRRSAKNFEDWQKSKILIQDEKPAVYFYLQKYELRRESKLRLGFIALLHLDEKKSGIFKHERTRLEPKEDRLKLLKAVRANLSPIFTIFSDKRRLIKNIYEKYTQEKKPFIEVKDKDKVLHQLWRVDSPEIIKKIQEDMQKTDIFIADGHHRYEVACIYRDELKRKLLRLPENAGANYILAYFTDALSSGITILPVHRIVKLDFGQAAGDLMAKFQEYFTVEPVKDKQRLFFLMEKAARAEHVFGAYLEKKYWLLRLKNIKILDKMIKDKSDASKSLDITVLNVIILKGILGYDIEDEGNIGFSHDAEELINKADNAEGQAIVFILNPVKMQQLISVSSSGEKMPSKSTYFYPKVLSGLVVNKHE